MLEGIQQTYPGLNPFYPQALGSQGGFNNPLAGVMGSGIQGLFGNGGVGRGIDPIIQAYLQQTQLTHQSNPQTPFGNILGGAGSQFGRSPYDPITAVYLQQLALQNHLANLIPQGYGHPMMMSQGNPFGPVGNSIFQQPGRQVPLGVDPLTIALLQQVRWAQQFQQMPFGAHPFQNQPFQGQIGAGSYGPLSSW